MRFFILFFSCLLISACAGKPSSIITATSPLPPGVRGTVPASGSDCQYHLLGLIPITSSPNTQSALSEAKEDCSCDVLTDVTVDENSFWVILWSGRCVHVRGLGVPPHRTGERVGDYDGIVER